MGLDSGKVIFQKTSFLVAPSIKAASSNENGIVSKKPLAIKYPNPAPPE